MPNFAAARKNMVDCQIHTAGITNNAILDAFRNVPRETFVPAAIQKIAYADEDLPLGAGRYLAEPIVHSKMVQAVEPTANDLVMDIGGAGGYPASIMSSMVRGVVAVEDKPAFLDHGLQFWRSRGMGNIGPVQAPLTIGCPDFAPYDIIFINGAVAEIPEQFLPQLASGGRLIAVVKKRGAQMGQVTLVKNSVGDKFSSRVLFEAGGHYLPGFEPREEFVFQKA